MASVILCDEHPMFTDALAGAMDPANNRVLATTRDPEQLVEMAARQRPEVCVVGVHYAGTSRTDLPARVKAASPGTKVLVLTASEGAARWEAYDAGLADGVVHKSSSLGMVEDAIAEVRAGHRTIVGCRREFEPSSPDVGLTSREQAVLCLLAEGASTQEIVSALSISRNTVRTHVQHVLDKLQARSRTAAVQLALAAGLVPMERVGTA